MLESPYKDVDFLLPLMTWKGWIALGEHSNAEKTNLPTLSRLSSGCPLPPPPPGSTSHLHMSIIQP